MAESLNPYEAPQTLELPTASFAASPPESESLVAAPPEVKRWVKAALWLYWISFVVPYAPWVWSSQQNWHWGIGAATCIFGIFLCWYPPLFSWWANVMFWIAYRDMNRITSGRALCFAIAGFVLAPIIGIVEFLEPITWDDNGRVEKFFPGSILTSAPYLCWLGSMGLMLIAAIKLRHVVSRSKEFEATHD